jgi:hypothetical protein
MPCESTILLGAVIQRMILIVTNSCVSMKGLEDEIK